MTATFEDALLDLVRDAVRDELERAYPRMEPRMLTLGEVAVVAGVSPRSIRRAIERGELRVAKIGRSVRVPSAEARRWMEEATL